MTLTGKHYSDAATIDNIKEDGCEFLSIDDEKDLIPVFLNNI